MIVTPLYASVLVILFLVLTFRVIGRRRTGISLGDGGDAAMLRLIRGHGNFAEYVPLALLLLAILEVSRFSFYFLHAIGIALVAARLLHGYALSFSTHSKFGRMGGAGLTFIVLGVEAIACLYQAIQGHTLWLRGAL